MARHGRTFPIAAHKNYQGKIGIYFYRSLSFAKTETITVTDSFAKIVGRYLTETIPIFDSIFSSMVRTLTIVENIVITDVQALTKTILLLAQTITVTDLVGFGKRARDF